MENLSLTVVYLRTNKESALFNRQPYINKNPIFQRDYEAWDDKLRTRFIESIILNRATNPIWTVLNPEDDSEEILDGMHRITTALTFYNNEFAINKQYLTSLDKEKYDKKTFNTLDSEDKAKVRNYNFIFNKLDDSYRKDMNKLKDMYHILNRCSITLNDYEFNKVTLRPFYNIIQKHKEAFIKSDFFSKMKDSRGKIETEIIELIVLSNPLPKSWSSVNNIKEEWIKDNIGETIENVNTYIQTQGESLENKLSFMTKIVDFLQNKLFSSDPKIRRKFFLPYKLIISRCCHLISNWALFNRISPKITENFTKEILIDNIQSDLKCTTRNASFQKRMIEKIDNIILAELNEEGIVRRFPKSMIQAKLLEQNRICTKCNNIINEKDEYDADHIIPWTAGGKTVPDNLQILHKRCHVLKSI